MLSAGDPGPAQQREHRPVLDDSFDWSALGQRLISDVNNFELTEWLIGNEVTLNFTLEFFKSTAPRGATGPWQGFVYDTTKDDPPKARLWIFTSSERHTPPIVSHDGSKLTICDAVNRTYPTAKTLDDLKTQFLGSNLIKEPHDSDSSDDDETQRLAATKGNKKANLRLPSLRQLQHRTRLRIPALPRKLAPGHVGTQLSGLQPLPSPACKKLLASLVNRTRRR